MEYMQDHLERAGGGATLVYPAASNLMLKSNNGVSPSDAPDGYSSYSRQGVDIDYPLQGIRYRLLCPYCRLL